MTEHDNCSGCPEKDTCQAIYKQIGQAQGPSVVWKAIVAFLLPIVVFIIVLAVSERLLYNIIGSEKLRTIAGLLSGIAASFVYIFSVRAINAHLSNRTRDCGLQGDAR